MSSKIRNTYFIYVLSVVISVVALVSCSTVGEELFLGEEPAQGEPDIVEVSLGLPSLSVATRTSIESDNGDTAGSSLTAKWDKGDSFGLFIRSDEDAAVRFEILDEVLEESGISEPYKFTNDNVHNLQGDIFVGRIPRMPNDADDAEPAVYNYYAYYPYDALSVATSSANEVHCRIPNIQSGRYDDGADIMVAAARGHRLNQQRLNEVDFKFRHLTHALKITIPKTKNYFGRNIDRITIEFPQFVAGDAVLDLDDITVGADAVPVLNTDGLKYRTIEVRFDEPLSPETDNTFWVFVAPVDLTGQNVVFRAFDDDGCMMSEEFTVKEFKTLQQQHITPVSIPVREGIGVTWFDYNIVECMERLGEGIESLTLTLPAGYEFADGGSTKVFDNFDDTYSFSYALRTTDISGLDGQMIATEYESEHAIIKDERYALGITPCTPNIHNDRTEPCPYLFFEDFNGITSNDNHDDDLNLSSTSAGYGSDTSYELTKAQLYGWYGARCGAYVGGYVRILNRSQYAGALVFVPGNYRGRVDSPSMSNLKDDASVRLQVTFDYSMDRARNNSSEYIQHYFAVGTHTTSGGVNTDSGTGTTLANLLDSDIYLTSFSTDMSTTMTCKTNDVCTKDNRFVWEAYVNGNIPRPSGLIAGNYHNYWVYIDNVRVTIVNE